jgi:hypothetical protein
VSFGWSFFVTSKLFFSMFLSSSASFHCSGDSCRFLLNVGFQKISKILYRYFIFRRDSGFFRLGRRDTGLVNHQFALTACWWKIGGWLSTSVRIVEKIALLTNQYIQYTDYLDRKKTIFIDASYTKFTPNFSSTRCQGNILRFAILKGQCHEIFDPRFFFVNRSPWLIP